MFRQSPVRGILTALAVLVFLAVPALLGYEVGQRGDGVDADAASAVLPSSRNQVPAPSGASDDGDDADLAALADQVDDAVVNIVTSVEGGGEAAGTGIVISETGLVLTNNHVIAGTTGLTVEFGESGVTRNAKVLGYSIVDDVALIQIQNAGNRLVAAKVGSSSSLDIGETVLALGNAGGRGGSPTVTPGTVTALEQEITASDTDGTNVQTLDGLIELAASIQSGDSGGPVVDTTGTVVGMNVAASVRNGFSLPGRSAGEGYAIPIEDAVAIAKRISSGAGGPDIRVGATRGVLGVQVQPELTASRDVPGRGAASGGGAAVVGVEEGSGADKAGIEVGDVITAVDGRDVTSGGELIRALVPYDPGESVTLTWQDTDGATQRGSVKLGEGPPA